MSDDSWKGEHLIRGIGRVERAPETSGGKVVTTGCKKCGKSLSKSNVIGYCYRHKHLGTNYLTGNQGRKRKD